MSLTLQKISSINFGNKPEVKKNENPISKSGEAAMLAQVTFFGGLALGGRLLFELLSDGFVVEDLIDAGSKIANKNKNAAGKLKPLATAACAVGLIGLFVTGVAVLYTIFNAPKINYNAKVNSFKKSKDMDVYIKSNSIESNLYSQITNQAKNADEAEKEKLKEQYLKLKAAKNEVPEFAKLSA